MSIRAASRVLVATGVAISAAFGAWAQNPECAAHGAPCHVADRIGMAGIGSMTELETFIGRLRAAAGSKDHPALAATVRYPLTIYENGTAVRTYADSAALLTDFDAVFTRRVTGAIIASDADTLFVNDQGAMIGNGEVWIDGWSGAIEIKAINP